MSLSKTRICLILHAPLGGGSERFMIQLAQKLSRVKFDITFILLNGEGEYKELLPKDIPIIDLNIRLPGPQELTSIRSILKLSKTFKLVKPDVIFSTLGYTNIFTIIAKIFAGIKAKVIIREVVTLSNSLQDDPWKQFKKLMFRQIYRWADIIVAPAPDVLDDLKIYLKLNHIRTVHIPNFINQSAIDSIVTQNPDTLTRTTIPKIITIGRLTKQKGYDISLQAFANVRRKIPCEYFILGQGPLDHELKKQAQELKVSDDIHFFGFQKDPYSFLKNADIFLLATRYEGFPNVVLEAMYCGLSCIVTKYDQYIQSIIKHNETGFLVNVDDVTAMSTCLENLLINLEERKRLAHNGYLKSLEFTSEKIVSRYEYLFMEKI